MRRTIPLTSKTVFQLEVLRSEIGKWPAKLSQFSFRAMNFESRQIGDLQQFSQQHSDILKMRERGLRIAITFPAMHLIAIETETVVQAAGLGFGFLDELFAELFGLGNLAGMNFEIRNNRAASVSGGH